MSIYSYRLTDTGYEILVNGVAPIITQPHSPNFGMNFKHTPEVNERLAKLVVAKLELGVSPLVLISEEADLMNNARTDDEIRAMAQAYKDSLSQPV